jgi:hypothetical protein
MAATLDKALKRQLQLGDGLFVLTISPEGFKLVRKRRRNGLEMRWEDIISGDAALAIALNASLNSNLRPAAGGKKSQRPDYTLP